MRKRSMSVAGAMLTLAAIGCGGSTNSWTCNFASSVGGCYEWSASGVSLTSAQVSELQQQCTASGLAGATVSTGSTCPSTNRVGTCQFTQVQVPGVSYKIVLYTPNYNAQSGLAFCNAAGGTWTQG